MKNIWLLTMVPKSSYGQSICFIPMKLVRPLLILIAYIACIELKLAAGTNLTDPQKSQKLNTNHNIYFNCIQLNSFRLHIHAD